MAEEKIVTFEEIDDESIGIFINGKDTGLLIDHESFGWGGLGMVQNLITDLAKELGAKVVR